jgi:hypothetical protein
MDMRYVLTDSMAKAGFNRYKLNALPYAVFDALNTAWDNNDEEGMEKVLEAEGLTLEEFVLEDDYDEEEE